MYILKERPYKIDITIKNLVLGLLRISPNSTHLSYTCVESCNSQMEFGERPTLTPLVMEQGLVDLQETLSNMVILQAMQYRELAVVY